MEHIRQDSPSARWLAGHLPSDQPFCLVDVGCLGGLDPGWRVFGEKLTALGFEPSVAEVARLQSAEQNPRVHYIAGYVGWDPAEGPMPAWTRPRQSPRLSFHRALEVRGLSSSVPGVGELIQNDAGESSRSDGETTADSADLGRSIYVPAALARLGAPAVDFVKIDCDGPDFEILKGLAPIFGSVLGATLEVNYLGTDAADEHTFHNTDRLMRSLGFHLFGLTIRRYSAETLPFPFELDCAAQTTGGRPFQGDAFYARHGGGLDGDLLTPVQLLKLASIFTLFGLPDSAAEVLDRHRARLAGLVDVDEALERLCAEIQTLAPDEGPRAFGSYSEYQAAFDREDPRMYDVVRRRQEELANIKDELGAVRRENDRLVAELEFARKALDLAGIQGDGFWAPLEGGFQSLVTAYPSADILPATFGTPRTAWDYGACSQPIAIERSATVRITARAVGGKIGFCLVGENLAGLVSEQVAILPEDGVRTVFIDANPQAAPVRLTIRNYDDDGVAGEVELISVEIAEVAR